ncbi:hypothetical protein F5148DRAFT_550558 [Russula earlei]|uniref:Uncharacterized protein n=1 Tax=Russula earlei TaxID=71964 RepID=A0ACC0UHB5_9AGAM|nr:hypothetical protein F5148DRAFT_550558 [Russula earlei]
MVLSSALTVRIRAQESQKVLQMPMVDKSQRARSAGSSFSIALAALVLPHLPPPSLFFPSFVPISRKKISRAHYIANRQGKPFFPSQCSLSTRRPWTQTRCATTFTVSQFGLGRCGRCFDLHACTFSTGKNHQERQTNNGLAQKKSPADDLSLSNVLQIQIRVGRRLTNECRTRAVAPPVPQPRSRIGLTPTLERHRQRVLFSSRVPPSGGGDVGTRENVQVTCALLVVSTPPVS